ncbi:hypothetical protein TWF506_004837 [Arthrobotrys conoides]|uniref:Uncharacterized protein n=1 Tax=Arthrobotrys conoides TaxID=74498 RepID=A0AAN8NSG8_9PEZI
MHFTLNIPTTVAFLSFASSIYGHGLIADAYGNHNAKARGRGLGFIDQYNNNRWGTGQHPFQVDVPVFKDPIIPCCNKPRVYNPNGCGITLQIIWRNNIRDNKHLVKQGWYTPAIQSLFTSRRGYTLDMNYEKNLIVAKKLMPQVTAGGWLKVRIHQVNVDGAGPYRYRIDSTATANHFGGWLWPTVNMPGNKYSFNVATIHKPNNWMHLPIPAGLRCTGTVGPYKNVCVLRAENHAVNGPFGGCLLFQQVGLPVPAAPKPLTPVAVPTVAPPPPTVTVTEQAPTVTIIKGRPPTKEEIAIAIGGEPIPKEALEEVKEEKIPSGKGAELVEEAKGANEEAADKAETEAVQDDDYE